MSAINIPLASLADTKQLAETIAGVVDAGDAILLSGELGTGKTTFAQFFIRALAGDAVEVTSPTFTLVQPYTVEIEGKPVELLHFDLYRIEETSGLTELGIDDAGEAIRVIEWPQKMTGDVALPSWLSLHFVLDGGMRAVTIRMDGAIAQAFREGA